MTYINRTLCYKSLRSLFYTKMPLLTTVPLQMCFPRGQSRLSSKGGVKGLSRVHIKARPRIGDRYECLWENTFFIFPFHTWVASTFLWTFPTPTPPPVNVLCNVSLSLCSTMNKTGMLPTFAPRRNWQGHGRREWMESYKHTLLR
jgi:hypothetical protein